MFSRRHVPLIFPYPVHKTETIVREVPAPVSPTDSARLLRELQAKAEENILESLRLHNNIIDCIVHIGRDMADRSIRFKVIMAVNGKRLVVEHTELEIPDVAAGRNAGLLALRDKIAVRIASEVLGDAINQHLR